MERGQQTDKNDLEKANARPGARSAHGPEVADVASVNRRKCIRRALTRQDERGLGAEGLDPLGEPTWFEMVGIQRAGLLEYSPTERDR